MSRRLLRRGLLSAALFGAATFAPFTAAKPPDLPAEVKSEATPVVVPDDGTLPVQLPAAPVVNQAGNTLPESATFPYPLGDVESKPAFNRLRLKERQTLTSCLLFSAHPLLALVPPDSVLYLPEEIREGLAKDAAPGLSAEEIAACVGTGPSPTLTGFGLPEPPKLTACPYLSQPHAAPTIVDVTERTPLDNLESLVESRRLLESGKEMLRTGRVCEALDFFEKISRLCPGSRYEEMAQAVAAEVMKLIPAAEEEAEEGAKQKDEEQNSEVRQRLIEMLSPFLRTSDDYRVRQIEELLKQSAELRQLEQEWEQYWHLGQQVKLHVIVAEVNRSAARSIGLNTCLTNNNGVRSFPYDTGNQLSCNLRKAEGVRIKSEPVLTTLNGCTTNFQAGGSFPVPVVTGNTCTCMVGVSYVPFGVQLAFTPLITDKDRIRLNINANVSTRDITTGTIIAGASVPGLTTRNINTTVELRDGATVALTGLNLTNLQDEANIVPMFTALPIIGRFIELGIASVDETELVILVQPELVHPLPVRDVQLPGTDRIDQNNVTIPPPPTIERSPNGSLDADESEEEESLRAIEFSGTPLGVIMSDLLNGQGVNLFPEKPAAPEWQEEEQEEPIRETKAKEIERHLNMPVNVKYNNVPLRQVIEDFRQMYGLNIWVDEQALADKGISADRSVTMKLEEIPLQSVLRLMLKNFGLCFVVENDVVQITSPEKNVPKSVAVDDTTEVQKESNSCTALHLVPPVSLSCSPCVEPGARIMADGLLKAARLALESGQHDKAADLARQAYALDPKRMENDTAVYSLYLLVTEPTKTGCRVNNFKPACCVAGCGHSVTATVAGEPTLRPNLPGVDPRIVAALEKVWAPAEAKRPRLELVIEEEQELREPAKSVEIEEPFVLEGPAKRKYGVYKDAMAAQWAWESLCDVAAPDDCVELLKTVVDFRIGVVLSDLGAKSSWHVSYSLLGWHVEQIPFDDDEEE